jgi:hypothetical protein
VVKKIELKRGFENFSYSIPEVAMRLIFSIPIVLIITGAVSLFVEDPTAMADEAQTTAADTDNKSEPLAHIVFFSLAEPNDDNREKLVEGCKKYLDKHDGVVYFGVGVNAPEYNREVNDRDYDVALHLVFETAKHQDTYQTHPRHVKFVEECQGMWKKVRVFDSKLK